MVKTWPGIRHRSSVATFRSASGGQRRQLLDRLVDAEGRRTLARWELPEGLQELRGDRGRVEDQEVVPEQPLVVGVRGDVGVLERVGTEVEQLRHPQRHERLGPYLERSRHSLLHED